MEKKKEEKKEEPKKVQRKKHISNKEVYLLKRNRFSYFLVISFAGLLILVTGVAWY